VWILNNDAVVEEHALGRMLDVAEQDSRVAMVGSALLHYDRPDVVQALGGGYIVPIICHDTQLAAGMPIADIGASTIDVHHLIGASLLVRAAAVRDVGFMDESYFLYREETDWCIQMRRRGWRLCCRADALVWHKQTRAIGFKSTLHDYYAVRNILRLVRKFYPWSLPTAFTYFTLRSLLPKVARLQFSRAGAVLRALGHFSMGIEGRLAQHSDVAIMRQYVPSSVPVMDSSGFATTAQVARAAVMALALLLISIFAARGAVNSALIGSLVLGRRVHHTLLNAPRASSVSRKISTVPLRSVVPGRATPHGVPILTGVATVATAPNAPAKHARAAPVADSPEAMSMLPNGRTKLADKSGAP
ncbi:MAG TPA: glycosyltransferase family 2 protein, partial [Candidatus Baltobacteraceae bacterium]|nr:glycosyltransferase family 2 protein [Candidatus Baltobacteraceae bacterium]